MGARLAAYYAEAETLAGLDGKIQLAMLTRITSTRALVEPDSPDNLSRFEGAMHTLRRAHPHHEASGFFASVGASEVEHVGSTRRPMADGEELFWGVLGSLHDAVIGIFDRDAQCLMVWEARSLEERYPTTEAYVSVGDTIARLVGAHCGEEIRALYDGKHAHREEIACTIHEQPARLSISLSAVHDSQAHVVAVHAFVQDVTAYKLKSEALERTEARLREQLRAFRELLREAAEGEPRARLQRLTEIGARGLATHTASVWELDAGRERLTCVARYDGRQTLRGDEEVLAERCPSYFDALAKLRPIAVASVQTDHRALQCMEGHPRLRAATSLLHVPLSHRGACVGVLCFENCGSGSHTFSSDEVEFAETLAASAASALHKLHSEGR